MNGKVLKLKIKEPNQDIIDLLERYLKDAKEGKLEAILLLAEYPETYIGSFAGNVDIAKRLGMLEYAKLKWMMETQRNG